METRIVGEELPVVICKLKAGETVLTENGGMSWLVRKWRSGEIYTLAFL